MVLREVPLSAVFGNYGCDGRHESGRNGVAEPIAGLSPPLTAGSPRRKRRRHAGFAIEHQGVANRDERQAEMFGNRASRGFGLIDQKHVDAGGTDGVGGVPANHFGRFSYGFDGEAKGREALELAEFCERHGQRTVRMVGLAYGGEFQTLGENLRFEVCQMDDGGSMASGEEFPAERSERVQVAGYRRSYDSEVHRRALSQRARSE